MKNKFFTILSLVLAIVLSTSPVSAAGFKLSAGFKLGSLIAYGNVSGTNQNAITIVLQAQGTCTLDGEPVSVSAIGTQFLPGSEESATQRSYLVETSLQNVQGCNNNVGNQDGFVFWTKASISVFSGEITPCSVSQSWCNGDGDGDDDDLPSLLSPTSATDNALLISQDYNCTTNQDAHSVACNPTTKKHNSGSDTVSICHATGSKTNPYQLITVSANGLNGHSKHAGDIIPAPAGGCPTSSK